MAVAAFTRQVIALLAVGLDLGVEQHALIDKPLHAGFGVARHEGDGVTIAQARSGDQRILHVRFDAVRFVKDGGNAALRIKGGAFADRAFAQYGDRTVLR
nr:Uncharacterised protein [Raoultella sp. NCTC 9187]